MAVHYCKRLNFETFIMERRLFSQLIKNLQIFGYYLLNLLKMGI